jgi:hypothetical protein
MEIWAKPRNPTPKTSLGIVFGNRLWESRWYKWYKNVYGLKILDSIPVAIDCTYILITHTYMHMHVHTRTCIYHLRRCLSCYLRSWHTHTLSHTHTNTHTHTHTLSLSLSLSLSHTHTHTHTFSLSLSLSLSHTHTHWMNRRLRRTSAKFSCSKSISCRRRASMVPQPGRIVWGQVRRHGPECFFLDG